MTVRLPLERAGQRGPAGPLGPFEELGADWRCPDCGTPPQNFRPCWPELAEPQAAQ